MVIEPPPVGGSQVDAAQVDRSKRRVAHRHAAQPMHPIGAQLVVCNGEPLENLGHLHGLGEMTRPVEADQVVREIDAPQRRVLADGLAERRQPAVAHDAVALQRESFEVLVLLELPRQLV